MTNETDRLKSNKTKVEFYMREQIKCHVDKIDKFFYNGFILKKIEEEVYLIKDDILGEQHLFLEEVYKVDSFRQPKDKPKYNNF